MKARLSEGYKPDFDLDLRYGENGQRFVSTFLHGLLDGTVEVKADAKYLNTGNIYLEYECKRRDGWQPSGIAVSTADYWALVLADTLVIGIPTSVLRAIYKRALDPALRYRREEKDGSHPTRGVAIPLGHFLTWVWIELVHADEDVA
jgi:hypothetical protein